MVSDVISLIKVDSKSSIPKYLQIVNSISKAVEENKIERGEQIPSINQICEEYSLSRQPVLVAFKELKARGIISSSPGKGYYIAATEVKPDHKIFLLFDELNAFKEVLYNSFKALMEDKGTIEIFFHHHNTRVFETLIRESIGSYTSYVVMPIPNQSTTPLLKEIPEDRLYILDISKDTLGQQYPSVCQDFEKDVYQSLHSGLELIRKYRELVLVFPDVIANPKEIIAGFKAFCKDNEVNYQIINSLSEKELVEKDAYLVIDDNDLVNLILQARALNLKPGQDFGIISYNDTPLKKVVGEGITTISTDFAAMGRSMAEMILSKKHQQIHNPSTLIKRASL